ncbi:MAG: hypothetical protein HOM61_08300 [Candidatus Marinimicrobia bacterium]|jgi:hypothetical protein|nr:hypothetical protein [Candidatus Neomarinimicrobiota bacterium]
MKKLILLLTLTMMFGRSLNMHSNPNGHPGSLNVKLDCHFIDFTSLSPFESDPVLITDSSQIWDLSFNMPLADWLTVAVEVNDYLKIYELHYGKNPMEEKYVLSAEMHLSPFFWK